MIQYLIQINSILLIKMGYRSGACLRLNLTIIILVYLSHYHFLPFATPVTLQYYFQIFKMLTKRHMICLTNKPNRNCPNRQMVYICPLVSVRSQALDAHLKQGMVITGRREIPRESREIPSYLKETIHNSSTTLTGDGEDGGSEKLLRETCLEIHVWNRSLQSHTCYVPPSWK